MSPSTEPRRAAVAFVFVTIVLDMLALGMIIPVLPRIVSDFVGGDTASAAHSLGLFGTVWAAMQLVFAPLMGALSDRVGRRPVILISNVGLGLDYVLMALAPSLGWLLVGRIISGITAASISTSNAYLADVTPPAERSRAFGKLGVAFGLGFVLGPALGGLLGEGNPRLPFWCAAVFSLLNATWGLLVMPESLTPELRTPFSWRKANPLGSLRLLRQSPRLLGLSGVTFLASVAQGALPAVFVLYAGHRFGWGERSVGLSLAAIGVFSAFAQGALVGPLVARFGERRAILIGLAFGISGFAVCGLAPTSAGFWCGIPLVALWGVAGPAAQSLMSGAVGPDEQGRLQGATGAITGISALVSPTLYTQVLAAALGRQVTGVDISGAPFLVSAALLVVAALATLHVTRLPQAPATSAASAP